MNTFYRILYMTIFLSVSYSFSLRRGLSGILNQGNGGLILKFNQGEENPEYESIETCVQPLYAKEDEFVENLPLAALDEILDMVTGYEYLGSEELNSGLRDIFSRVGYCEFMDEHFGSYISCLGQVKGLTCTNEEGKQFVQRWLDFIEANVTCKLKAKVC
eukprot:snap_masked-scaffold_18-processed-gene-4.22-mRNA-1 protein AED:1.00 eAED:1.00 QI:0/-1/0/0/-1/1/1/0/159